MRLATGLSICFKALTASGSYSTLQAKSAPYVIDGHRLAMASTDIHGILSHGVLPLQPVKTGLDQLTQIKSLRPAGGSREMVKAFLGLMR